MYKLKVDENCPKTYHFLLLWHSSGCWEFLVRFHFCKNEPWQTVCWRWFAGFFNKSRAKETHKLDRLLLVFGWPAGSCDTQKQNNGQTHLENYANSIKILFLRIFHLTLNVVGAADTDTHTNCLSNFSAKYFKLTWMGFSLLILNFVVAHWATAMTTNKRMCLDLSANGAVKRYLMFSKERKTQIWKCAIIDLITGVLIDLSAEWNGRNYCYLP